jgi:hypothetical protein
VIFIIETGIICKKSTGKMMGIADSIKRRIIKMINKSMLTTI